MIFLRCAVIRHGPKGDRGALHPGSVFLSAWPCDCLACFVVQLDALVHLTRSLLQTGNLKAGWPFFIENGVQSSGLGSGPFPSRSPFPIALSVMIAVSCSPLRHRRRFPWPSPSRSPFPVALSVTNAVSRSPFRHDRRFP